MQHYSRKVFLIPPVYFILAMALCYSCYRGLPQFNLIRPPFSCLAGVPLCILGSVFMLSSVFFLKKQHTTFHFVKSTTLVVRGTYHLSRNPIYLGMLIFLLGLSAVFGNVVAPVSVLFLFCVIDFMFIPYEEEKMEIELGQPYLDYKSRVRRWL
jgi:protein-S-isoprenylcysteine O-methyltransferase Ste14